MNEPTELQKAQHRVDAAYRAFIEVGGEYKPVRKRFEEAELEWADAEDELERIKGGE